jgi:hypothetical protein
VTEASLGRLGHRLADAALALPLGGLRLQLLRGEGRRRQVRPADATDARVAAGPRRRRRRERYGGFCGFDLAFNLGSFRGRFLPLCGLLLIFLAPGVGTGVCGAFARPLSFGLSRRLPSLVGSCFRGRRVLLLLGGFRLGLLCLFGVRSLLVRYSLICLLGFSLCLSDLGVRLGAGEGSLGSSFLYAFVLGDLGGPRLWEACVGRGDGVG